MSSLSAGSRAAGLPRIVAACAYDAILTVAILFVTAGTVVLLNEGSAVPAGSSSFRALLLASAFPYYAVCWLRGGQTLGMRTWHLRLETADGTPVRFWQVLLRYLVATLSLAAAGVGFLWVLVDGRRRSWHDIASRTRLVITVARTSA